MVSVQRSGPKRNPFTCFGLVAIQPGQRNQRQSISSHSSGEPTISTVTITANIATFDRDDALAARAVIAQDNVRRAAANLPLLPSTTAAEMRASYQTIMAARLMVAHLANVESATVSNVTVKAIRDAALVATDAQRTAALAALTT